MVAMPGVILHKTSDPLELGPVGDTFPESIPYEFILNAYGIDVLETKGAQKLMSSDECVADDNSTTNNNHDRFGAALLSKARSMFMERGLEEELDAFLENGSSNPNSGPRRMHWVGIEIKPNQSLALHSHPNIEFAYIVEGVMHEFRLNPKSATKKKMYVPETIEVNGVYQKKFVGPNLSEVDASKEGTFVHNIFHEGDLFINTIGDVHQSFTKEEGVKLFALWGDGNADVPDDELPQNASFLNRQSAQAWT